MRLYELIVEGYKEAQQEFTLAANNDQEGIKKLIQSYKDLVNRNQVSGNERNIDYWRKQGFLAFKEFVVAKQSTPTTTEIKRKKIPGKSITLRETNKWLIVIPLDKNSSCFHGKNSDWCTTKPTANHFEHYFYNKEITLIYCLNKETAGMWAIAAHTLANEIELFDREDNAITPEEFKQQTGLNPHAVVRLAHSNTNKETLSKSRVTYQTASYELEKLYTNGKLGQEQSTEVEGLLEVTKIPKYCAQYIERLYWANNDTPVKVSKSIIEAACTEYSYVLEYVDLNGLPDSYVYRLGTTYRVMDMIFRTGYEPSKEFLKKLFDNTSESSHKYYVVALIRKGTPIPNEYVLEVLRGSYAADTISTAYKASNTIPPEEVFVKIVNLFPHAIYEFIDAGAKPSKEAIISSLEYATHPESLLYKLSSKGIEVTDDIVMAAVNDSASEQDKDSLLLQCLFMLVANKVRPSNNLIQKLSKESEETINAGIQKFLGN